MQVELCGGHYSSGFHYHRTPSLRHKGKYARTKLAATMNKLFIRVAEAEDVALLGEGEQEKASN